MCTKRIRLTDKQSGLTLLLDCTPIKIVEQRWDEFRREYCRLILNFGASEKTVDVKETFDEIAETLYEIEMNKHERN